MAIEAIAAFAFFIGILSFLSPCIIPMIIVYLTTITGFSLEQLAGLRRATDLRGRLFKSTLAFAASFTLIFTLFGAGAGFAGSQLAQLSNYMQYFAGFLFLIFGISLLGVFRLPHSSQLSQIRSSLDTTLRRAGFRRNDGSLSYAGIFLVGAVFSIVCSHCFGPTFYPVLGLAAATASPQEGALLLFSFSLGLALPFLLASLFLSSALSYLELAKKHSRAISLLTGAALILFGIILITGNYLSFVSLIRALVPWRVPGM